MRAVLLVAAIAGTAWAQPKHGPAPGPVAAGAAAAKADKPAPTLKAGAPKEKTFDFNGIDLNGRNHNPQLLYFLERANEELERASLEKRSFIPAMKQSVEDEAL